MFRRKSPACAGSARVLRRFLSDECGSATVEFVLWLPVFGILLIVAVDATVLYLQHSEMWNVSRDVARRLAVSDITEEQVANYVADQLFLFSHAYTVATSDPKDLDVQVVIQTRVADASVFGFFEPLLDRYLTAAVTMRREPI